MCLSLVVIFVFVCECRPVCLSMQQYPVGSVRPPLASSTLLLFFVLLDLIGPVRARRREMLLVYVRTHFFFVAACALLVPKYILSRFQLEKYYCTTTTTKSQPTAESP